MPENLPTELLTVKELALSFIKEEIDPRRDQLASDGLESVGASVREASKNAGFFYKTQPAEFGGAPASTLELTLLREMFAACNCPLTRYIFGPGPGVLHAVDGVLRSEYLEPVMRGEKRGAFGFTEPDTAQRPSWARIDGDQLVINGQKSYVTGGATADFVSALLNVENADGSSAAAIRRRP